ncbi:hypothetical protein POX_a01542 [Penicillium oxalicum]|uniref:Zn(2)-C6 fungal-type domain-containing protein n=1 Tax=Penicillium oxalicum (strain 114-2 / CGMCC 5302) TaxID=933388 RepID=S7ZXH2_PENO1|nr:hypothetical protein POX_a01542 [Penicillium oxalicum]EPS33466.1 hypothetical protein PDE_08428 [Penicillium oxalicum 114-2]KAI2794941.1 hypothetical protein POX_a01542 [Penicillium oxalicum]
MDPLGLSMFVDEEVARQQPQVPTSDIDFDLDGFEVTDLPLSGDLFVPFTFDEAFTLDEAISHFEMNTEMNSNTMPSRGLVQTWALPVETARLPGLCGPMPQSGFDYYYNTLPQPIYGHSAEDPPPLQGSALLDKAPQGRPSARLPTITISHTFSIHEGVFAGPSCTGPVDVDKPTPTATPRSQDLPLTILLEDPANGRFHRDKMVRTQRERDEQKKGMRILKASGGACVACNKRKKRCGPGNPCPPCTQRGCECIRTGAVRSPAKTTGSKLLFSPPSGRMDDSPEPITTPSSRLTTPHPMAVGSSGLTTPSSLPNSSPAPSVFSSSGWGDSDTTQYPPSSSPSEFPDDTTVDPRSDEGLIYSHIVPFDAHFEAFTCNPREFGMRRVVGAYGYSTQTRAKPDTSGYWTP